MSEEPVDGSEGVQLTADEVHHILVDLTPLYPDGGVPLSVIKFAGQEVRRMIVASGLLKLWREGRVVMAGIEEEEIVWRLRESRD